MLAKPGSRFSCAILFLLLGFSGQVFAQCVPPSSLVLNPTVRFAVEEPRLIYRHDLDLVGLSNYTNTFERAPRGAIVLGLTRRNDPLSLELQTLQTPSTDGRICYWVTELDARLGGADQEVYVAGNYAPGTCEYQTVLDHESTHVAINQEVLRAYVPILGQALRGAVRQRFPVISRDPGLADRMSEMLMASVEPVYDQMIAELRRRNAAIDTPENYRRTSALCRNWFPPGTPMPDGTLRRK